MKKRISLFLAALGLMMCSIHACAALPELYLYSPALDAMGYVGYEESEEAYCEYYLSEDGLIQTEVLTVAATEYGLVGEGSFYDLMELRAEGNMANVEEVLCESIGSYPAQRLRFETGSNEDSSVVDATAFWTDTKTFVYIVTVDADAWYGFVDGYEEGTAQAMVDQWITELEVGGYEYTDGSDFAQTDVVLVADRSCGISDAEELELVERFEAMIEGECDVNALADGLTVLTGLDFTVDSYYQDEKILTVDWKADSTLTAGLDDREQKEEFFFYDEVSLNWFMLDSLYATICENFDVEEVYYTMNGGEELSQIELGIMDSLPVDVPYMGSAFYYAHSDAMGDELGDYTVYAEENAEFEANDYGFFDNYIDTEFFRIGIPAHWRDIYEYEIVQMEPFGYIITFSEKENGFVFSLEARWFDDEVVQLESVWQGYLGRMSVERLGHLDLLVTYSQPVPDIEGPWQTMYDTCREVVDTLVMQDGVMLEEGEYYEYQP